MTLIVMSYLKSLEMLTSQIRMEDLGPKIQKRHIVSTISRQQSDPPALQEDCEWLGWQLNHPAELRVPVGEHLTAVGVVVLQNRRVHQPAFTPLSVPHRHYREI